VTASSADAALLRVTASDLLNGLRRLARGEAAEDDVQHVLGRAGIRDANGLTPAGAALHKLAWVLGKQDAAKESLGKALRPLLPVQVMEQELRGFGQIPEEGVLELLQVHGAAPPDMDMKQARAAFKVLSDLDLVVYSQKFKTVRLAHVPEADVMAIGEDPRLSALFSPKTPYSNVVKVRQILRSLVGTVFWVDKHFRSRALEELASEADPSVVTRIFILSGDQPDVLTDRSLRDFKRFTEEMANKGVEAEWRSLPAKDIHDRWLLDDKKGYNIPAVGSIFSNQWGEALPTEARPPVADWWKSATPRNVPS
jgi:hypothetical protein